MTRQKIVWRCNYEPDASLGTRDIAVPANKYISSDSDMYCERNR